MRHIPGKPSLKITVIYANRLFIHSRPTLSVRKCILRYKNLNILSSSYMFSLTLLSTEDAVSGLGPAFSQFYSTTETLEVKWLNARSHNESVPPANQSSNAANTCSFDLDHPASSFKSMSLRRKLVLQILFTDIKGGWSVAQADQLVLVFGMQRKLHL